MSDPVAPGGHGPGPTTDALAALASEMLDNARHWEALNNPDRSVQFHQAAALYSYAANFALANGL